MPSNSRIVHEWFSNDGPKTFEYLLPVRELAPEHTRHLNEWLRRFAESEPSVAKEKFRQYLTEIAIPELRPFLDLLSRLAPYSVVVHDARAWLLCKLPDRFADLSEHENMILLPSPNENVNWPRVLAADSMAPLRHFLRYFAGTRIDIPPISGFSWPDVWQPAVEDPATFAWKNIRSWQHSLPIYSPGNGDAVLVDSNGRFGRWDHGMTNQDFVDRMIRVHDMERPDDGAVFLIGNFAQFVSFFVKDVGIDVLTAEDEENCE